MTTQSKSCITSSLSQADRIVAQLRAADFSAEEISVLMPSEARPDSEPANPSGDPESNGGGREPKNVLVSVHLKDGRRIGRAEEIFCRADSEARTPARLDDKSPQSWVKAPGSLAR